MMEKFDILFKGIVKRFFNEKEVTSTFVMDVFYCGCCVLDIVENDLEVKVIFVSILNKCFVVMSIV